MAGYIGNIPVPQATQTRDTFTATAGQTTFATSGYTPSFLDVFLNGVHLVNGTDYTASNGSDVVLTSGAAAGDTLEVVSYSTFEVLDQNFTGTTTADNLTVTGAFTSRGIDDNATSTAMTLDASGNLLVGTTDTNPADDTAAGYGLAYNINFGGSLLVKSNNNATVTLNRTASDGDILAFRKDGSTVGSIGTDTGDLHIYSTASGHAGLRFGNTRLQPTDNTGTVVDNAIDIGVSNSRFKNLYLSGGVYLGGTGAANHLDDYEEGTFTPLLLAQLSNPTVSYNAANKGVYIKIGRMVHFVIALDVSSYSGGSGQAKVSLPFAVQGSGDYSQNFIPFPTQQWGGNVNPTRTNLLGRGSAADTAMTFRSDDNTGSTDEALSIFPTSGFFMRITGSYTATS